MIAGLTAGSIAAIFAVLVSLPLRSPSDTLLNSATVALAGLLAAATAGIIWRLVRYSNRRQIYFGGVWTVIFLPAAGIAIYIGQSQLDHFIPFAAPLAAVIFIATGLLTVAIARYFPQMRWWGAGIAIALALGVGLALAEQGDQASGELQLPPPTSMPVPFREHFETLDAASA